eukprot:TRINITY_DN1495_c0_g1_i3.p1 TRINITY_DN1495_c0_g1~~TRINITY_DN1495_c0_g1_i3.p1  ORF type:complete len:582 (-),score=71.05 TRINITY_DN1495_c0_g1_i3:46-1638(-)
MVRFWVLNLFVVSSIALDLLPRPKEITLGDETVIVGKCSIQLLSSEASLQPLLKLYQPFWSSQCLSNDKPVFTIRLEKTSTEADCNSESYELTINKTGARACATCSLGLIRAFSTLIQIFESDSENVLLTSLPVRIKDEPRFAYRGLMVDTARRFMSKEFILRVIQGMMLAKLNVLHWHISDDDSFPMFSTNYRGLSFDAAFSKTMIYYPEDIREITRYAEERGVRVVPEVGTLSHVRAIGLHRPLREIVACFNSPAPYDVKDVYTIRGGPPKGVLDPSKGKTYEFIRGIAADVVNYFKDEYVHLGGDDVKTECWDKIPDIKQFMKEHNLSNYEELITYHFNREHEILKDLNASKKVVRWLSDRKSEVKYSPEAILHYRGLSQNIPRLKDLYPKNKFIMSPIDFVHTDCGNENAYGGKASCTPFHTWSKMYNFEPTNYNLPQDRVLGGAVCAFSEALNEDSVEAKVWPRAAAFAAALWEPRRSGKADLQKLVLGIVKMSKELKRIGAGTSPITGKFCELGENECFVPWHA